LTEASETARSIGALQLSEAVARVATRARIGLPAADRKQLVAMGPGRPLRSDAAPGRSTDEVDRDRFGLTPREWAVLQILVEGRTNREIGERLYISDRTVGIHVRQILAKLGASTRG